MSTCFDDQVWHRGAPNNSDQVRYVGSVVYSQRVVAQRLYPFIDYLMPDYVWEGADVRMQRIRQTLSGDDPGPALPP